MPEQPIQGTVVSPPLEPEQLAQQPTLSQEQGQVAANTLNRPLQDLFQDNRRPDFFKICVPMYEASLKGEWDDAYKILHFFAEDNDQGQDDSYLLRFSITNNSETALHVATSTQNLNFVTKLVGLMRIEDVQLQNENGNTALCLAAMTGNVDIAKIMVDHNPNQNGNENQNQNQNENQNQNQDLLTIRNNNGMTPLDIAALYGKGEMVSYLNSKMNQSRWIYENNKWVCLRCVETELFDIALNIFPHLPVLTGRDRVSYSEIHNILGVLARKPHAFDETNSIMAYFNERPHANRNKGMLLTRILTAGKDLLDPHANRNKGMLLLTQILKATETYGKDLLDDVLRGPRNPMTRPSTDHSQPPTQINEYPSRILFVAAERGNTKFIVELIRKYPDLIWKVDDNNQSIFHTAVSHRHESIYNLLYEIGSMKDFIVALIDKNENNMLHLAGNMVDKNRLKDVSGAAFQMQRELLWYKEVESMLPASYQEKRNKDDKTPYELFTETHKDLLSESEKWMRGTASKCMLVATLIATIVFTVAYTVPGGYDNNVDSKNRFPVFLNFEPFIVFVTLDALSFFLSITSILVFLSIQTSRYAQDDFINSLPEKLILGLFMLFLSIITMLIAFIFSLFVLYRHSWTMKAVYISLFAIMPYLQHALVLHWVLITVMVRSTFGISNLFKPEKPMLYHRNPTI